MRILDFNSFRINESSLKKLKKELHGVLGFGDRKRMRKELRNNIITFKFRKKNGELRTAHGTLHPDYLPKLKGGAPRPEHQMVYYDLDKEGWRSFRSYSFIKITNIESVDGSSPAPKHTVKPVSKPVPTKLKKAHEEDDEEETKTIHTPEPEEKDVKKVHKEEPEEKEIKKVHKEERDEKPEKEEKLYKEESEEPEKKEHHKDEEPEEKPEHSEHHKEEKHKHDEDERPKHYDKHKKDKEDEED